MQKIILNKQVNTYINKVSNKLIKCTMKTLVYPTIKDKKYLPWNDQRILVWCVWKLLRHKPIKLTFSSQKYLLSKTTPASYRFGFHTCGPEKKSGGSLDGK